MQKREWGSELRAPSRRIVVVNRPPTGCGLTGQRIAVV